MDLVGVSTKKKLASFPRITADFNGLCTTTTLFFVDIIVKNVSATVKSKFIASLRRKRNNQMKIQLQLLFEIGRCA